MKSTRLQISGDVILQTSLSFPIEQKRLIPSIIHLELFLHGRINKGGGVGQGGQQLVVNRLQAFPQLGEVCIKTLLAVLGPVLDIDVWQCGGGVGGCGACKRKILESNISEIFGHFTCSWCCSTCASVVVM